MATETVEGYSGHVRSVTVTTLASLFGVVAALISEYGISADPSSSVSVFVLIAAIGVQIPILKVAGFDTSEFSTKDYLFIGFMTFSLWFISWTLILTAQTV